MGKSTIFMAIFNSYVSHYQRVIDVISLIAETYVLIACRFDVINPHPIPGFIELDDGKMLRKPLDLMVEICHNHGFMQIFHHFPLPSGNLT